MDDDAALLLWPDTVDAFYADRACSIRSAATRKTWATRTAGCNASTPARCSAGSRPTISSPS
jgi:hypothetical protein